MDKNVVGIFFSLAGPAPHLHSNVVREWTTYRLTTLPVL